MLHNIWDALLYHPLINALAFLISIVPGGDVGLAVILLTILVKLLLFPLSQKTIENQAAMAVLAPELNKIKASGLGKEEQARLTFELYKKHKTNPFSGCLLLFIQIPIIFALYYVFYKGMNFSDGVLYSFVSIPTQIDNVFLGLIDLSKKSLFLALLAGVSQYLQAYFMPAPKQKVSSDPDSFAESLAKNMQTQMKYVFPVLVAFISYTISGVVALYWTVSNLFAVAQQIYVNKTETKRLIQEKKELAQ